MPISAIDKERIANEIAGHISGMPATSTEQFQAIISSLRTILDPDFIFTIPEPINAKVISIRNYIDPDFSVVPTEDHGEFIAFVHDIIRRRITSLSRLNPAEILEFINDQEEEERKRISGQHAHMAAATRPPEGLIIPSNHHIDILIDTIIHLTEEEITAAHEQVATTDEQVKTAKETVTSAQERVTTAKEREDAAKISIDIAQEKLADIEQRLKAGSATIHEKISALQEKITACENQLSASKLYKTATLELLSANQEIVKICNENCQAHTLLTNLLSKRVEKMTAGIRDISLAISFLPTNLDNEANRITLASIAPHLWQANVRIEEIIQTLSLNLLPETEITTFEQKIGQIFVTRNFFTQEILDAIVLAGVNAPALVNAIIGEQIPQELRAYQIPIRGENLRTLRAAGPYAEDVMRGLILLNRRGRGPALSELPRHIQTSSLTTISTFLWRIVASHSNVPIVLLTSQSRKDFVNAGPNAKYIVTALELLYEASPALVNPTSFATLVDANADAIQAARDIISGRRARSLRSCP